jgi:DNA repair exonuclease SbcCD ATPase subunit
MAAEQLQIQVQANVTNAVNGLNDLNKTLAATNTAAVKTGTAGMNALAKGSGQATAALTNFSRVASDAPFGLIGIANNIDPLVQSFVTLRKETGTTGGAFKALGASLAGGGGLILGISLLTSALQFAQLGFSRWGASATKAKEDSDKLKQAQDQLIETTTKQRLEFETLVKVAKDATQTELARNQALQKLNEILPDTIGKLNQQNIATAQGEEIIRSYIKAVEAKATAELLAGRIATNNVQIYDLQQQSLQEISELTKDIERNTRLRKNLEGSGKLEQEAIAQKRISDGQKEIVNIQKDTQKEIDKINKLNESLRNEYEKQIPLVNTLNDSKEKTVKKTDEIADLLKKYRDELKGINWDEQNLQIDGIQKRLELAGNTLRDLVVKGVKETSAAFQQVNRDLQSFQLDSKFARLADVITKVNEGVRQQANEFSASEDAFQKANTKSLEIAQKNIKVILGNYELWKKGNAKLIEQQALLAATITDLVTPAIDGVINAFAQGEDPFEALAQSVRNLIAELTKAVIKSLILKAITSAIAGPAGAAAGGGAGNFIIRGDLLRNITLGR